MIAEFLYDYLLCDVNRQSSQKARKRAVGRTKTACRSCPCACKPSEYNHIADEPTAALNKATADEIMEVMKSLNSIGKTIVIVTHDRTVAEKCRRIVELSDGEIISDKTIA